MITGFISHEEWQAIFLLTLPLIVGGIVHMFIVKKDILSYFKKPIHQRWFGNNKTWRGFIIMPLATWPGVLLAQKLEQLFDLNTQLLLSHSSVVLALGLGLGYCLAELPNSFLKRRLGIKEGITSEKFKWFFIVLDQADSAFGCLIVYKLFMPISWKIFWLTIFAGTIIHLLINFLLFSVGLRKNRF